MKNEGRKRERRIGKNATSKRTICWGRSGTCANQIAFEKELIEVIRYEGTFVAHLPPLPLFLLLSRWLS